MPHKPNPKILPDGRVSLRILVREELFHFISFEDWVNFAQIRFRNHGHDSRSAICVDSDGMICTRGKQFREARYPVRTYAVDDRAFEAVGKASSMKHPISVERRALALILKRLALMDGSGRGPWFGNESREVIQLLNSALSESVARPERERIPMMNREETIKRLIEAAVPEFKTALRALLNGASSYRFMIADGSNVHPILIWEKTTDDGEAPGN